MIAVVGVLAQGGCRECDSCAEQGQCLPADLVACKDSVRVCPADGTSGSADQDGTLDGSGDAVDGEGRTLDLADLEGEDGSVVSDALDMDGLEPADLEDSELPEVPPGGEFRGIWVSRWEYSSASDIETIMENAAAWGFNAVFFQVRAVADAYYQSNLEPWSARLSGTLGKDPGWDPLGVAIQEAHARDLELHAWVNTFTAWTGTTPPPLSEPRHILYDYPSWRVVNDEGEFMAWNSSYSWVSPAIPGVRQHIEQVLLDIVAHYDVDGIHLDYIRYPGPSYSHDGWSIAGYQDGQALDPTLTWGEYQRDLLSRFVGRLYDAITDAAPHVKVSAAVWGIYQNVLQWSGVSQGYHDYFQDSHRWIQEGAVDALLPMIYWPMTHPKGGKLDFATLTDMHLAVQGNRHVYPGISADYDDVSELADQIAYVRSVGGPGIALFSYSALRDKGHGEKLAPTVFDTPQPTPSMSWK
jgi:uncharacterized lipoprotein YddW (UPF0748 family)